ncbi:hypothetical protein BDZ91DRAFT_714078 [Kalaharituber pfeilii]|nr:hypothetical protein BDZ91DRAFT_714078 [Kalaharituber pfeilii]
MRMIRGSRSANFLIALIARPSSSIFTALIHRPGHCIRATGVEVVASDIRHTNERLLTPSMVTCNLHCRSRSAS